jgi:transposase
LPSDHCTQAIGLLRDRRPETVLADKGYDTDAILNNLGERGIAASSRPDPSARSRAASTHPLPPTQPHRMNLRSLKQFRRLATQFDKLRQNFQATVAIVCAWRWLTQYVDTP